MAGTFAMMLPAFMENYIIVPPFSLILLILIAVVRHTDPCKKGESMLQ
jgi:hypothetical protein